MTGFNGSTSQDAPRLPVSIGIMAYNEESTIGAVIEAFLRQRTTVTVPAELIVVASGCTDGTVQQVRRLAQTDTRIRLIVEPKREGKLSAVRRFLREAVCEIVVISGADTMPSDDLLDSFGRRMIAEPDVGMTGARIVPDRPPASLAARLHGLLWDLHHQVALRSPKLGEIVAVRRSSVTELSDRVNCDEVALEANIVGAGARLAYEPSARVINSSPTRMTEYLYQRRRNRCLHHWAVDQLHYQPSTNSIRHVVRAVAAHLRQKPGDLPLVVLAVGMEVVAELLARGDFRNGQDYRVWQPLASARAPKRSSADRPVGPAHRDGTDTGGPVSEDMPRVGVVAVVFGQDGDELRHFLQSVDGLSYGHLRLYLVNNDAGRALRDDLGPRWAPRTRVIDTGANLGFTGGANAGIRAALHDGCQQVLLLNTDIDVLRPDLVERLQEPFRADPDCGMASPVITQAPRTERIWYAGASIGRWSGIPRHRSLGHRYRPPPHPAGRLVPVSSGCGVLIGRSLLERVGGFDETLFCYYEEVDLSLRARGAGYRVYLWPEALIAHHKQGRSLDPVESYYLARNAYLFIATHLPKTRIVVAVASQLAVALPVYLLRASSGPARLEALRGTLDGLRRLWNATQQQQPGQCASRPGPGVDRCRLSLRRCAPRRRVQPPVRSAVHSSHTG